MRMKDRKLVLGISGGIAAYKCAELVRQWTREGAEVEVVMTRAAQEFITPLTMETLANRRVHTDLFPRDEFSATIHIDLADEADVIIVAPATANVIARLRHGMGDDLLTTVCLAGWRKTIIAPAMNSNMWDNPAVRENIDVLRKRGYLIIEPTSGDLACGYTGTGRMPDPPFINHWIYYALQQDKPLEGRKVLVTAGRTEEEIDPVRIITNRSSGKMGFALAEAAFYRGADVTLVSGPNSLTPMPGINYVPVVSADEMYQAVIERLDDVDVLIANAAVSDYRSKDVFFRKMKKDKAGMTLDLVSNPDILAEAGRRKHQRLLVGFALETHNEKENAREKLRNKNLDMIVLNNPAETGSAFAADTNRVLIFKKRGREKTLPLQSKHEVAGRVIEEIIDLMKKKSGKKTPNAKK